MCPPQHLTPGLRHSHSRLLAGVGGSSATQQGLNPQGQGNGLKRNAYAGIISGPAVAQGGETQASTLRVMWQLPYVGTPVMGFVL